MEIATELLDSNVCADRLGRRFRPKSERDRLAAESYVCGLKLSEFALREGVNYNTLVNWRTQYSKRACGAGARPVALASHESASSPATTFTECVVPLAPKSVCLEVFLCGGTVVRGDDAAAVAALVKALRC